MNDEHGTMDDDVRIAMRARHPRSERPLLRSKLLLLGAVAAALFVLSAVVRERARQQAVANEIRAIEQEVVTLEAKRQRLTTLLEHAETPEFLEREARLRLGLQRPGEEVLIVPEGNTPAPAPDAVAAGQEPNWKRWWRYVFGTQRQR